MLNYKHNTSILRNKKKQKKNETKTKKERKGTEEQKPRNGKGQII